MLATTISSTTAAVVRAATGSAGARRGAPSAFAATRPVGSSATFQTAHLASTRRSQRVCLSRGRAQKTTVTTRVTASADATASSVKIIVQGRNIKITDAIREYTENKVGRAVSNFDESDGVREVDVQCSVRGGNVGDGAEVQKTEVTIYTKAGIVRAEEEGDNLYKSIDLVSDQVYRKLRKLKERQSSKAARRGKKSAKDVSADIVEAMEDAASMDDEDEEEFDFGTIVREKYHAVKVMSVHAAIEEMEQVGHSFYAFRSAKDGEINVVYARDAGGYGVLIPCDIDDAGADPTRK